MVNRFCTVIYSERLNSRGMISIPRLLSVVTLFLSLPVFGDPVIVTGIDVRMDNPGAADNVGLRIPEYDDRRIVQQDLLHIEEHLFLFRRLRVRGQRIA